MSGLYNHKYTLKDFFNSDGTFKQYVTGNKLVYEEHKTTKTNLKGKARQDYINKNLGKNNRSEMSVDLNRVIDLLYDFCIPPFVRNYKNGSVEKEGSTISIDGALKKNRSLDIAYEDVYNTIKNNKGMLEQLLSNYSMFMDAIAFSYSMKTTPHLYLTLNNKTQLKNKTFLGRISSARTMFMSELMENIYFNDSFKAIRQKYGIEEERMLRKGNILSKYDYEKERWEKKVGKK